MPCFIVNKFEYVWGGGGTSLYMSGVGQGNLYGKDKSEGGRTLYGGGTLYRDPPVNRMTNRKDCKHYLPVTLFAGSNKLIKSLSLTDL